MTKTTLIPHLYLVILNEGGRTIEYRIHALDAKGAIAQFAQWVADDDALFDHPGAAQWAPGGAARRARVRDVTDNAVAMPVLQEALFLLFDALTDPADGSPVSPAAGAAWEQISALLEPLMPADTKATAARSRRG